MGVWLNVVKPDLSEHPTWSGGLAGEKALFHRSDSLPGKDMQVDGISLWRPTDFTAFRQHNWAPDYNEDHWSQLADILEAGGDWWIHFSA